MGSLGRWGRALALLLCGCSHDWNKPQAMTDAETGGDDDADAGVTSGAEGGPAEGGSASPGPEGQPQGAAGALTGPSVASAGSCVALSLRDPSGASAQERSVGLRVTPAGSARVFADASCTQAIEQASFAKGSATTALYVRGLLAVSAVRTEVRIAVSGAIAAQHMLELRRAATDVVVGDGLVCALLDDGEVYCWGLGPRVGGSARGDIAGVPTHVELGAERAVRLAAGVAAACALTRSGNVLCWGENAAIQAQTAASAVPRALPNLTQGVSDLCVGSAHGCAVRDAALYCWGDNRVGQAGQPSSQRLVEAPTRVADFASDVVAVRCGFEHTCATRRDGSVGCMGNRNWSVPAGGKSTSVDGFDAALCVLRDGAVQCRGKLSEGLDWTELQSVASLHEGVSRLAVGSQHACAIKGDRAYCMGSNADGSNNVHGAVGGEQAQVSAPRAVDVEAMPGKVSAIAVSHGYPWLHEGTSCAVADGLVYCWGANLYGELGASLALTARTRPERIAQLDGMDVDELYLPAAEVSDFACALAAGKAYCWGLNCDGQLNEANGCFAQSDAKPRLIPLDGSASKLSLGGGFACALVGEQVYCWGFNDRKQAGAYTGVPSQISFPDARPAIDLATGNRHACALVREGAVERVVYCWGDHSVGLLGDAVDLPGGAGSPPVKALLASTKIGALAAAVNDTCAVVDDRVQCWGATWHGDLAQPDAYRPRWVDSISAEAGRPISALQLMGGGSGCLLRNETLSCFNPWTLPQRASEVTKLRAGPRQYCGVRRNGALFCGGDNASAQLATGGFTSSDSPQEVSGLVAPIKTFATGGGRHGLSCARDAEGVKCWGSNVGRVFGWEPTMRARPGLVAAWDVDQGS